MRKLSFFAALVVAMTAVSCVEDINSDAPAANDGAVTFEASFGAMSKAVLEPGETESKVAWEAGDQVSVLAGESNWLYTAAAAGYSTTLATEATDVPAEGEFYAVFPYDADASLAEGVISTTLPAEQTPVPGSFSTHLAVAKADGGHLAFKNVCGLVKVTVDAENVTKIVFEGNNSEVVAGGIAVTVSDNPSWTAVAEQGATSVTLAPAEGTIAKGVYYFAVLPQTFANGFKVTAYKGEESWVIRNVAVSTTIERAGIVGGKAFFEIEGNGTESNPYILKTPQDLVNMRTLATCGGETWFKMANDINMEGVTNYLPVNYEEGFNRKIHFDGSDKTISNFTCDKSVNGGNYPSLFGVLYGSVKNLKVDNATIISTSGCGVIGGYVGTGGKPGLVENVTITNSSVTNSGDRAGGVCGDAKEATFRNVSFQGTVTSTYTTKEARSGGFCGFTETSAVFEDCSADVTVVGSSNDLGGFVGKVTGTAEFTGCEVKVAITSTAAEKNRCGGFIGWNASTETNIENCHVLSGSTVTDGSSKTAVKNGNFAGFIGYGDTSNTVLNINDCSVNATVNAGEYSTQNSGLIGAIGYESTVTIENTSVEGDVKSSRNYAGGFVGYLGADSNVQINGCSYAGSVAGGAGVGGIVGGNEGSTLGITKSHVTGNITNSGHNGGGLVGWVNGSTSITNCWSDVTVTLKSSQFGGGIAGGVQKQLIVKNCYVCGKMDVSRGAGGIVGQIKGAAPEIEGCIAWCSIVTNRGKTQYSPGAIVGNIQIDGKYMKCYRKADMTFTDVIMKLVDHADVESGRPPLPDYGDVVADQNQYAYHGKAAAADATISSVARSIGWDETVWDLSGDVPALK